MICQRRVVMSLRVNLSPLFINYNILKYGLLMKIRKVFNTPRIVLVIFYLKHVKSIHRTSTAETMMLLFV